VLEELLAGECWNHVVDPALAHPSSDGAVDDKARPDPRPAFIVVERCDLAIDPIPVSLVSELPTGEGDLFRARLDQIIDLKHVLGVSGLFSVASLPSA
jgi:hypothetical protein